MRPTRYQLGERKRPDLAPEHDLDILLELYLLERVRRVVRRDLQVHSGQQDLAREIGISRGSLRKFVEDQSIPSSPVQQRLRDWVDSRPPIWTPRGAVALALLVHDLPYQQRGEARRRLARELAAIHAEAGRELPRWLAEEIER